MMLSEDAPVPVAVLPLQEMRYHLRLGSGFAEDGLQDGLGLKILKQDKTLCIF